MPFSTLTTKDNTIDVRMQSKQIAHTKGTKKTSRKNSKLHRAASQDSIGIKHPSMSPSQQISMDLASSLDLPRKSHGSECVKKQSLLRANNKKGSSSSSSQQKQQERVSRSSTQRPRTCDGQPVMKSRQSMTKNGQKDHQNCSESNKPLTGVDTRKMIRYSRRTPLFPPVSSHVAASPTVHRQSQTSQVPTREGEGRASAQGPGGAKKTIRQLSTEHKRVVQGQHPYKVSVVSLKLPNIRT